MSLFDFFFPQQAAASHLRAMREQQYEAMRRSANTRVGESETAEQRISELERDVGFLSLMLAGLLDLLEERGTVSREDVRKRLEALDLIDGVRDGRLNVRELKESLRRAPS